MPEIRQLSQCLWVALCDQGVYTRAIGTIGNKWKPMIINVIGTRTMRFGQLDAIVPHISRKVLTGQLKELEEDGLLERLAYKEIPPRVDYKLSEKGLAFLPILEAIKEWNIKYEVAVMPEETGLG